MANRREIILTPLTFGMSGFKVEDLLSKDFMAELRKEFPTVTVAHCCIGFTDSRDMVTVGHDRREGQFNMERVDVEGSEAKLVARMVEALKRMFA